MSANETQVGGTHYKADDEQVRRAKLVGWSAPIGHWNFVMLYNYDYVCGNATKYLDRFLKKGTPVQDLEKVIHYLTYRKELLTTGAITHWSNGEMNHDLLATLPMEVKDFPTVESFAFVRGYEALTTSILRKVHDHYEDESAEAAADTLEEAIELTNVLLEDVRYRVALAQETMAKLGSTPTPAARRKR